MRTYRSARHTTAPEYDLKRRYLLPPVWLGALPLRVERRRPWHAPIVAAALARLARCNAPH